MRLGLIARADWSGLGVQTQAYYKHLKPHKTVVIDSSPFNGHKQNYDWYENAHIIHGLPTNQDVDFILDDIDVLLTAETPYNQQLYVEAARRGVKTVCVENPEFFDQFLYKHYPLPDLIILPSVWKEDEIRAYAEPRGTKVIQLHHPVDRNDFPFRLRTGQRTFHVAGKPATFDRNGTYDYLTAVPDGTVTTQDEAYAQKLRKEFRFSRVHHSIAEPYQLYGMGDIMVLPRRYGGNCLPLNEALSSGLPVIMPDISPNNHLLPKAWLANAEIKDYFEPRGRVDVYKSNIDSLQERIAYVQINIEEESRRADRIAEIISWNTLLPVWREALESIL